MNAPPIKAEPSTTSTRYEGIHPMSTPSCATLTPTSWAPVGEFFCRTAGQIAADDRELAERKARGENASGTPTAQRKRVVNDGARGIATSIEASQEREGANV